MQLNRIDTPLGSSKERRELNARIYTLLDEYVYLSQVISHKLSLKVAYLNGVVLRKYV